MGHYGPIIIPRKYYILVDFEVFNFEETFPDFATLSLLGSSEVAEMTLQGLRALFPLSLVSIQKR